MRRRPNTRPTSIYWLIDNRPSTRAEGWQSGLPFYCGKTVYPVALRMAQHRHDAARFPARVLGRRVREIGSQYLRVVVMETVPASGDWAARERHWIATIRASFPNTLNTTSGGQGAPGLIISAATREHLSTVRRGRKLGERTRARMRKAALRRLGGRRQRFLTRQSCIRDRQARTAIRQAVEANRLLRLRLRRVLGATPVPPSQP